VGSERPSAGQLLNVLGVGFGVAVLVGNSIGMGILRTPGEVASHLPSVPLFMAIWVAGAGYALLGALSVAEISAMRPRSGGLFPLVHHALGPYLGFVSGWSDWIASCGSIAAVAIVLGEYIGPLVPMLAGREAVTASVVVVGFALLQWRGVRIGDVAQQVTSLIKGLALVALAVVALVLTSSTDPTPAATATPIAVPGGLALGAAIVIALQSAVFTYDGWGGPVYLAGEIKDPGRNIPRSMISGVLIVMGIYLALNLAFIRVIPIQEMAGDPFVAATVADRLFGPDGDTVIRVLMIISLIAAVNANQLMASRLPFAMARERLFPSIFARVNKGGTPVPSLWAGTALALGFIATNTFNAVLALLAFFFVANYALGFTSLFVLRWREPDTERPFRVPLYPIVPGIVLLGSIGYLIASLLGDSRNSLSSLGLLLLSWPVYRLIKR
jgi:APA family basic amino acid/polyamine antiporter